MQCPKCNQSLDNEAVFCGNCGTQIAPVQAPGATVAGSINEIETVMIRPVSAANKQGGQPPTLQRFSSASPPLYATAPASLPQTNVAHSAPRGKSPFTGARFRIVMALALIVIVGGAVGFFAATRNGGTNGTLGANATGQIAFIDNPNGAPGHTDALKISIQSLQPAPSGSQYDAWLVDTTSEKTLALGTLTASGQAFTLNFNGNGNSGQAGTNLLGAGDKVEVTLEQGTVSAPTSKVILSATFPPKAFVHIRHLLFSFPTTPGKIGLLVGLLEQAQLLNAQALTLQSAVANHNSSAVQCASQSIIDIIEGAQGSAYQPLSAACLAQNISAAGDGFGLLGNNAYVDLAAAHASLAATQSDSTDLIRLHAGHVEIAMTNIKGWAATVEQDALALRAAPGNTSVVQAIVSLCDHIYQGVDINGDERVDPVPGEAGAITGYNHGQLMATLQLVPGQ